MGWDDDHRQIRAHNAGKLVPLIHNRLNWRKMLFQRIRFNSYPLSHFLTQFKSPNFLLKWYLNSYCKKRKSFLIKEIEKNIYFSITFKKERGGGFCFLQKNAYDNPITISSFVTHLGYLHPSHRRLLPI